MRGVNLRNNAAQISPAAFAARKDYLVQAYKDGKFLADPEARGKPRPNPMTDPAMMEGMMGMMKGNVAMMVPQSLIMGWINAFFSGYVISKGSICLQRMGCILIPMRSETSVPINTTIQVHAPIWCRNARPGREMGVQFVVVLSDLVRPATCLQLHPRQQ